MIGIVIVLKVLVIHSLSYCETLIPFLLWLIHLSRIILTYKKLGQMKILSWKECSGVFRNEGLTKMGCCFWNRRLKSLYKLRKFYHSHNIHNTLKVPFKKSSLVSFASLIIKNIVSSFARSKFPVKLICCITLETASSASCLLKSVAILL